MIIAGTGHRPEKLGGYGAVATLNVVDFVTNWLRALETPPEKIITGMALGFDMALGLAAMRLGIPFIAVVPFRGHHKNWNYEMQDVYVRVLRKSAETVITSTGGYEPHKLQIRNRWMVDHCDTLIALWNGGPGGTANCVRYATERQKPIIHLWSEWVKK